MASTAAAAAPAAAAGTAPPPALVDAFGFRSPPRVDAAAGALPADAADASVAALAAEEGWWASDFALYIAWQQSVPRPVAPSPSTTAACAADTDAVLIERWFWGRWLTRLRASRGCPHASLRPLLWGFFAGVWRMPAAAQAAQASEYAALVRGIEAANATAAVAAGGTAQAAPGRAVLDAIERDVSRTFPSHLLFAGALGDAVGQRQLRRVLAAYAAVDVEVGYCQGMAFVAGVLLLAVPETMAFQVLRCLMGDGEDGCERPASPPSAPAPHGAEGGACRRRGGRHGLRQLYIGGFPLLQVLLRELEAHVAALLPALAAHLQAHDVRVDMFASQWFLTLFAHQLPPPVLLRVWDFFVASGWPVLVQVALGLLHQEQETLLTLSLEGVLLHLKDVRTRPQSEAELLRRVCSVPSLS